MPSQPRGVLIDGRAVAPTAAHLPDEEWHGSIVGLRRRSIRAHGNSKVAPPAQPWRQHDGRCATSGRLRHRHKMKKPRRRGRRGYFTVVSLFSSLLTKRVVVNVRLRQIEVLAFPAAGTMRRFGRICSPTRLGGWLPT